MCIYYLTVPSAFFTIIVLIILIGMNLTVFGLFDKTNKYLSKYLNKTEYSTEENSQTPTMEKGVIKLYAINSSKLLRYP